MGRAGSGDYPARGHGHRTQVPPGKGHGNSGQRGWLLAPKILVREIRGGPWVSVEHLRWAEVSAYMEIRGFCGIEVRKGTEDWQKEQGSVEEPGKQLVFPWSDFGKGEPDTRPCYYSKLPAE